MPISPVVTRRPWPPAGDPLYLAYHDEDVKDYPPYTEEAVAWAKDLKTRGFQFLGPTVLYAHMQAVGMVNDHTLDCFRRIRH